MRVKGMVIYGHFKRENGFVSTFDEIFERIKLATNTRTQVELADVLEIRQSSISDAKRRKSIPADWYMKLFEKFGLNPDWLKWETGPMYLRTLEGYAPKQDITVSALCEPPAVYGEPEAKSALVSVYSTHCAAAVPELEQLNMVGKLSVPLSFSNASTLVVKVETGSMEPVIPKGAHVGIDTMKKNVVMGEIYAVLMPYEGISMKRVFLDADNSRLILRAEHRDHPEQYVSLDKAMDRVVGRVDWVIARL